MNAAQQAEWRRDVANQLRWVAKELGETPSYAQYHAAGMEPTYPTIVGLFGCWHRAVAAAGLPQRRGTKCRDGVNTFGLPHCQGCGKPRTLRRLSNQPADPTRYCHACRRILNGKNSARTLDAPRKP